MKADEAVPPANNTGHRLSGPLQLLAYLLDLCHQQTSILIKKINMVDWIKQEEACEKLGIQRQTLYAYVSRGQIEVRKDDRNTGRSLYRMDDVTALLMKRSRGRTRKTIAASTMAWGEPIINTRISTISHGRLFYRGQDALVLSENAIFEDVARLLWDADERPVFPAYPPITMEGTPRARAYATLGFAAEAGAPGQALSPVMMYREAAAHIGRIASSFIPELNDQDNAAPLHERMARAWHCEDKTDLIRQCLVLLADQELTTSAFAARVTASTGATLGACALAGLAAFSGPLHGDAPLRVQHLLEGAHRDGVQPAVRRWMSGGQPLPGFGHPLYPDGDPRAARLLSGFTPSDITCELISYVHDLTGLPPTIDVALAALSEYCALPQGGPFFLFAIARSVGWMAHAIEQITTGSMLRPRAHYIGPSIAHGRRSSRSDAEDKDGGTED